LVGESEMTVEDETKVPSWISGIEWAVVNFSELFLETDEQNCKTYLFTSSTFGIEMTC